MTHRLGWVEEYLVDGVATVEVGRTAGVLAHVVKGGISDEQISTWEDAVLGKWSLSLSRGGGGSHGYGRRRVK